jgi:hypothetical protein
VRVEHAGRRTHWGFDATKVKAAFDALGYVKAKDGSLGLRMEQMTPALWKCTQELIAMVTGRDALIVQLAADVAALKAAK